MVALMIRVKAQQYVLVTRTATITRLKYSALQSEFAVVDPSGDGCFDPKEENGGIMVMTEEMDSEIPESKSDDEERGSCSTWNSDCGRSSGELQVCRSSPWKLMV
ncbi:hypothetical protein QQP08_012369 [Theobroma cacao]|nr:hypothetical protein QQP08_012369 [Theobroma cacao]